MKILSASQIRACDAFTIESEGIASFDLMERAATACLRWFQQNIAPSKPIIVICGMGNNGGDGLALTRLLLQEGYQAAALVWKHSASFSVDAARNFKLLQQLSSSNVTIFDNYLSLIAKIPTEASSVDAFLGTGLSRMVATDSAALIESINQLSNYKIAIDIPTGLFADQLPAPHHIALRANATLSFQFYKRCFLHEEASHYTGSIYILDIGLNKEYIAEAATTNFIISPEYASSLLQPRSRFSHKGSYGAALLIGGSYGKIGAIALSTRAALRSGAGLVFTAAPKCGNIILQSIAPEAMFVPSGDDLITELSIPDKVNALGVGPGMDTHRQSALVLDHLLQQNPCPLVLDADALNIIAANSWMDKVPHNSIITPHPKEFERLFGSATSTLAQVEQARTLAMRHQIFIVLKRNHTAILTPDGNCFYNTTGNPGMATGGSGDVLTGIITGLLAQGYKPQEACILGVFLHGSAGDLAAQELSEPALTASDIIDYLGKAFRAVKV
jgi:hydroxyethylthiazole kinase-like uncharacterized protein yjeF